MDISSAIRYNVKQRDKRLWDQSELPFPLSMPLIPGRSFFIKVDSQAFALLVVAFQARSGLKKDGKLGPGTLAAMRASADPITAEHDAGHEFESEEGTIALPAPKPLDGRPMRRGVSNCLIIDGQSVKLPKSMTDMGITASNYKDDGEHQFSQYRERKSVSVFVIHESVTMSSEQTNRVLDNKRIKSGRRGKNDGKGWDYGIHLNLCADGHITCHADLVRHRLVHANQMNDESIGIEVTNPYNPAFAGPPFTEVIEGPWWCWKPKNQPKKYTLPTRYQMRTIWPLVQFLTSTIPTLPLAFPTKDLNHRKKRIEGWDKDAKTGPGIVAHRDFASHADGRYLLEHCIDMSNKPFHEL